MAHIPDHVNQIIQKYLVALQADHILIEHAFLFGSYAKGTYNEWSDIDLALVSDSFEGCRIDRAVQFSGKSCHCEESSTKQTPDTCEIASQSLAMTSPF